MDNHQKRGVPGRPPSQVEEDLRREVGERRTREHLSKIVNGLDLSSPMLMAVNVYPGAAAPPVELVAAVRQMVQQSESAAEAILANIDLADMPSAQYRIRRITAEAVADRWCKTARAGMPNADISFMLPVWLDIARQPGDVIANEAPAVGERIVLQMAMLEALRPVMQEIEAFDLFRDKRDAAVHARNVILNTAIDSARMMAREGLDEGARRQLLSALVRNAGTLYATAWRKEAERIIEHLRPMDPEAQMEEVMAHKGGYPVEPVDDAFKSSFGNLTDMVRYLALPAAGAAPVPPERPAARGGLSGARDDGATKF